MVWVCGAGVPPNTTRISPGLPRHFAHGRHVCTHIEAQNEDPLRPAQAEELVGAVQVHGDCQFAVDHDWFLGDRCPGRDRSEGKGVDAFKLPPERGGAPVQRELVDRGRSRRARPATARREAEPKLRLATAAGHCQGIYAIRRRRIRAEHHDHKRLVRADLERIAIRRTGSNGATGVREIIIAQKPGIVIPEIRCAKQRAIARIQRDINAS